MDIAAIVATFGSTDWRELAMRRAVPSCRRQGFAEVVVHHGGDTIAEARNAARTATSAEWLCFVDADDELEDGYLAAMRAMRLDRGLLTPAVRFVDDPLDVDLPPAITLEARNIRTMNPCVIGTLLRRDVFDRAGGFWNERAWEDWSLFRRAHLLGESVVHVPGAVYRCHVNPTSRNNTVDRPEILHRQITRSHAAWLRRRP